MPAQSDEFPWPSYYGEFDFFEERMKSHSQVLSIARIDKGLYHLTTLDNRELKVFICECYAFGVAQYIESIQNLGPLDAVIINSNWCGYSDEVKLHCRNSKVGVFKIGEFMSALHHSDYWNFLSEWQAEMFREKGWI